MTAISFTEHPATVGETYAQHLRTAFGFSFAMIGGGLACFVHGVFPFLFTTTGSSTIRRLHERMVQHRVMVHGDTAARPTGPSHARPALDSHTL